MLDINTIIHHTKRWFNKRPNISTAIVGYSGGIDSATTAALLAHAGITTRVVQVCLKSQSLSSGYTSMDFSGDMNYLSGSKVYWDYIEMPVIPYLNDFGKEAALPILRNAYLYGMAAESRAEGNGAIVVGTANFDEAAYLGFWGKASDAAQDFYPISHLHKSEVYELAKCLGVSEKIINAIPSGDLQWSGSLNDYTMIGATYSQIENFAKYASDTKSIDKIVDYIKNNIDNPILFVQNINRNRFKYDLPFPNFHLYPKLELFRKSVYPRIAHAAHTYETLSNKDYDHA